MVISILFDKTCFITSNKSGKHFSDLVVNGVRSHAHAPHTPCICEACDYRTPEFQLRVWCHKTFISKYKSSDIECKFLIIFHCFVVLYLTSVSTGPIIRSHSITFLYKSSYLIKALKILPLLRFKLERE